MTNIETNHNFEKKNWIMFSGKMFFIFTNCNVSCLDNILLRQNFFLCQFCTWQRYVLVHVLKQFMSKGSMIMVKKRDYRRKMSFFLLNEKCYKVLYKFIIKSKDIILKVVQKWNIKLLLHLDISISVKGFFFPILCLDSYWFFKTMATIQSSLKNFFYTLYLTKISVIFDYVCAFCEENVEIIQHVFMTWNDLLIPV